MDSSEKPRNPIWINPPPSGNGPGGGINSPNGSGHRADLAGAVIPHTATTLCGRLAPTQHPPAELTKENLDSAVPVGLSIYIVCALHLKAFDKGIVDGKVCDFVLVASGLGAGRGLGWWAAGRVFLRKRIFLERANAWIKREGGREGTI